MYVIQTVITLSANSIMEIVRVSHVEPVPLML